MSPSVLQRIASGDSAAVRECIEQYGALVWSLARRLSRSPSDAEDATQEIFGYLAQCRSLRCIARLRQGVHRDDCAASFNRPPAQNHR